MDRGTTTQTPKDKCPSETIPETQTTDREMDKLHQRKPTGSPVDHHHKQTGNPVDHQHKPTGNPADHQYHQPSTSWTIHQEKSGTDHTGQYNYRTAGNPRTTG